jgi:hypothetical protein
MGEHLRLTSDAPVLARRSEDGTRFVTEWERQMADSLLAGGVPFAAAVDRARRLSRAQSPDPEFIPVGTLVIVIAGGEGRSDDPHLLVRSADGWVGRTRRSGTAPAAGLAQTAAGRAVR